MECITSGHDWQETENFFICKNCGLIKKKPRKLIKKFKWSDPRWCPQCGKVVTGGCPHCN